MFTKILNMFGIKTAAQLKAEQNAATQAAHWAHIEKIERQRITAQRLRQMRKAPGTTSKFSATQPFPKSGAVYSKSREEESSDLLSTMLVMDAMSSSQRSSENDFSPARHSECSTDDRTASSTSVDSGSFSDSTVSSSSSDMGSPNCSID